ncbi:hypothetical protein [Chlorogloeopsis sp. ULAP02]|uniref:hypothetical protein n=1 Tax=Chlorogloeopsis sp. ULAP02 TaxID=3107926 RepID=UPI00398A514E
MRSISCGDALVKGRRVKLKLLAAIEELFLKSAMIPSWRAGVLFQNSELTY